MVRVMRDRYSEAQGQNKWLRVLKREATKGAQESGRERKKKQRIKYREMKIESVDGEVSRLKRVEDIEIR